VERQIDELEGKRTEAIRTDEQGPEVEKVRQLLRLRGIGENGAWLLVRVFFGWRGIRNRRELASLAGLSPTRPNVSQGVLPGFSLSIREWFDRAERTAPRQAGIDVLSPSYHTMRKASDTAACDYLEDWCAASTTDSGSVSLGSNPKFPASSSHRALRRQTKWGSDCLERLHGRCRRGRSSINSIRRAGPVVNARHEGVVRLRVPAPSGLELGVDTVATDKP
jgi:hypothetical protein